MLERLTISPKTLNRLIAMSILPLMVFAIVGGAKASPSKREPIEAPHVGTLVVAGLRSETLTVHPLSEFGPSRTVALTSPAHELVPLNGRIYATLPRENQVIEIDTHAPGVLRTVETGPGAHGLTYDGEALWVTLDNATSVVSLDNRFFIPGETFPTGNTPHTVAADDTYLFITDSRDNTLRRITKDTGEVKTVATATMPESVTIASGMVVTAGANDGWLRWYTRDLEEIGSLQVGGQPVRIVPVGYNRVAVALNAAEHVAVVDLATASLEKSVRVAPRPDGLCLSPDGRFLAVVSNAADGVNIFRVNDWRLMTTLFAGDGPGSCAWY